MCRTLSWERDAGGDKQRRLRRGVRLLFGVLILVPGLSVTGSYSVQGNLQRGCRIKRMLWDSWSVIS